MKIMDDNVWEYPFGDLDEDDEMFFHKSPSIYTGQGISQSIGLAKYQHVVMPAEAERVGHCRLDLD